MVRIYVTKNDRIEKCENNLVTLKTESGEVFENLEPRRLFPVSRAEVYITLLNEDGVEVALIRDFDEIDKDSAAVVRASLDDYYLVPHILRIVSTEEKYGTLRWVVETDRGVKSFDIRNRNHDVKVFKDGKVRVRDSDDNRYVIDDFNKLDSHSRARLIADL